MKVTNPNFQRTIPLLLLLGLPLTLLLLQVGTGVPIVQALVLTLLVSLQAWGGFILARFIWPNLGLVEALGSGLAVGTAIAIPFGLLTVSVGWGAWGCMLPTALVIAVRILGFLVHRRQVPAERAVSLNDIDLPTLFAMSCAAVLGGFSFLVNIRSYPLEWSGTWSRFHPDMSFFEAVATSLAKYGPFDSIFTPGAELRYHWMTYAWGGQLTEIGHAGSFVLLTRVLPIVAIISSSFIVIGWTRRYTRNAWAPTLAAVLLLAGGYLGATYGSILNFDSPSQSLGTCWLLALSAISLQVVMQNPASGGTYAVSIGIISLLSFVLTSGKISEAFVALVGMSAVALLAVVRREPWRNRAVIVLVTMGVSSGLSYLAFLSGSNDSGGLKLGELVDRASSAQGLNPFPSSTGIVLGTLILVLAMTARWAGFFWLLGNRNVRWTVPVVFGLGLSGAGLLAVLLFNGGLNETWFAVGASAPLVVLVAAGATSAWGELLASSTSRRRVSGTLSVSAMIIYLVVWALWARSSGSTNQPLESLRWLAPLAGLACAAIAAGLIGRKSVEGRGRSFLAAFVVILVLVTAGGRFLGYGTGRLGVQTGYGDGLFSMKAPDAQTRDHDAIRDWPDSFLMAAQFLTGEQSSAGRVATNRTFGTLVPALTRRQTLISGFQYQYPYGRPGIGEVLLQRDAQSWAFIDDPSEETLKPLCSLDVEWVWIDPRLTTSRQWEPFGAIRYNSDAVILVQLDRSLCIPNASAIGREQAGTN